jgi:hypothetical protein
MIAPALLAALLFALPAAGQGTVVELPGRSVERDGVVVGFPGVVYEPFSVAGSSTTQACARTASEALGNRVDAARDLIVESMHRVVFRDPGDAAHILKIYRPDRAAPIRIARLIQRELGVQALLRQRGIRVAAIDERPGLLRRGVLRQARVDGRGLDAIYPQGYRIGDHPGVDRVLARIAAVDAPLRSIVSMQTGLFFTNTVDCYTDRPVGVDLGHCYGNIFLETRTNEPVFVDW